MPRRIAKKTLSMHEAADRIEVSFETMRHWGWERKIPVKITGSRSFRILEEELDAFVVGLSRVWSGHSEMNPDASTLQKELQAAHNRITELEAQVQLLIAENRQLNKHLAFQ